MAGNLSSATRAGNIDDGRAAVTEDEMAELVVFVFVGVGMDDTVAEIFTLGFCGKNLEGESLFVVKIVADIGYYLLFGGGSKTRNRDGLALLFLFLQLADEITDVEIVDAKIVSPSGETVGFVNDKADYVASHQQAFDGLRT